MTSATVNARALSRAWWRSLQPDPYGRGGDRGALAALRRCTTAEAAAGVPAALNLARALGIAHGEDRRLADALTTAVVLAHVRDDHYAMHPAQRLNECGLSPLRFARLLAAETVEERIIAFRRAVAMAEGRLDVGRLAAAVLAWPRHRIAWAFAYHAAAPPADTDIGGAETPTGEEFRV